MAIVPIVRTCFKRLQAKFAFRTYGQFRVRYPLGHRTKFKFRNVFTNIYTSRRNIEEFMII